MLKLKPLILCTFLLIINFFSAQKKPLDHSVYDAWESVGSRLISNDGKWLGYYVDAQEGDGNLYLYSTINKTQQKFPRASKFFLTSDSKFAIFTVKPFYKDIKAVKDKKLKKDKLAKDSLYLVNLSTNKIEKIANVKSYKAPFKGGSFVAYLFENLKEKSTDSPKDDDKDDAKDDDDKNAKPSELVVINLTTGQKQNYQNVVKYQFSENGKQLAFVTQKPEEKKDPKDKEKDKPKDKSKPKKYALQSVNLVNLENFAVNKLIEEEGDFAQLTFDKLGTQFALTGTTSAENDLVKDYNLYYFSKNKKAVLNQKSPKMPKDWVISENQAPNFSKNGKQLYFGVAPKPIAKDTALIANDHAILDVWSYKDDYLKTIQLKNLNKDLKKSYDAVLQTEKPETLTTLSNPEMDSIAIINEGNELFSLGISNNASRAESQWTGAEKKNYYIVNNLTGEATEFLKNLNGRIYPSPLGKFMVYFNREDGNWYAYNVDKKSTTQLNKGIAVKFTDEEFDMPDYPNAYGLEGFTDKDFSVIIKDRYDLWEFYLDGKTAPKNITNGFGRKNKISFDTYQLDKDIRSFNRNAEMYLFAFNEDNKQSGIFKTKISSAKNPEQLQMGDFYGYRNLVKAKNAEVYSYTKETYQEAPNVYSSVNFKTESKVSNINAQQNQYNWGTTELISWTTPKGYQSKGILYKPEDFDPNKKYPMIVYFYEKLSDGLNRYIAPSPTPSRLNIPYFVSNGYLVFTPDISYEDGHPGKSAVEFINSGVEYLKKNSWVNGEKIGIQGQSWGGYQVSYLITQNDMYAAAWAGAPVVNMTSAYGGIRWSTGMNRQFQYEKSQSRIGKTLWEAPELYLENSPLFHLDKVTTPVVIMSNDKDGAVPWYQGIEMFTALRRLDKKVWLLNYNNDDHNLTKRQNKKDIQIREQQFFDYYLKDAKAPVWMTRGIPSTLKGKDWGFELTDEKP
jgi:dienelactone hydrolase